MPRQQTKIGCSHFDPTCGSTSAWSVAVVHQLEKRIFLNLLLQFKFGCLCNVHFVASRMY